MQEKRRFKRVPVDNIKARYRIKQAKRDSLLSINDLSPEGIGFSSPIEIDSDKIEVEFEIDGHELHCKACLRWIKPKESSYGANHMGGLQITEISDHDKALLLIFYTNKLISLLLSNSYSSPVSL